eukprot:TRINITY_DN51755_c0_g1_i1.p1 TRINITY_DN51755_c0_g1~~TRINITY_DN51755_c0_g1_i1.p1  ORF type:complete len:538 (-),score=32.46 TRINITY_DN51755_c0_g1_i1:1030-2643(-)
MQQVRMVTSIHVRIMVMWILISFCLTQSLYPQLEEEEKVEAFLSLEIPSAKCDSTEELGMNTLQNIWNSALNCTNCASAYQLTSCSPVIIEYRIQNRGIDTSQIQKLLNTLIINPICLVDNFQKFTEVQINITSYSEPPLSVPSGNIRFERYDAQNYQLLSPCNISDGSHLSDQKRISIRDASDASQDTNDTEIGSQAAAIRIIFDNREVVSFPGEKQDAEEEIIYFDQNYDGGQVDSREHYSSANCTDNIVQLDQYGQYGIIPCDTQASKQTKLVVPSSPEDSLLPLQPDPVLITFFLQNFECEQVFEHIQTSSFLINWYTKLGCASCTQFNVTCTPNVTLIADSNITYDQVYLNTVYLNPDCLLYNISSEDIYDVRIDNIPYDLVDPRTITQKAEMLDTCYDLQIQIEDLNQVESMLFDGNPPNLIRNQDESVQEDKVLVKSQQIPNQEKTSTQSIVQYQTENEDKDSSGNIWWIIVIVVGALIVATAVFLIVYIPRRFQNSSSQQFVISGGPGKQAVLLARAEQFGYVPAMRAL